MGGVTSGAGNLFGHLGEGFAYLFGESRPDDPHAIPAAPPPPPDAADPRAQEAALAQRQRMLSMTGYKSTFTNGPRGDGSAWGRAGKGVPVGTPGGRPLPVGPDGLPIRDNSDAPNTSADRPTNFDEYFVGSGHAENAPIHDPRNDPAYSGGGSFLRGLADDRAAEIPADQGPEGAPPIYDPRTGTWRPANAPVDGNSGGRSPTYRPAPAPRGANTTAAGAGTSVDMAGYPVYLRRILFPSGGGGAATGNSPRTRLR